ncbi:MAG: peptidoglycan editing factor PgeF [Casimicrobiaceae bacterium]
MNGLPEPSLAVAFGAQDLDWILPAWDAPSRVHAFATTRHRGIQPFDVGGAQFRRDAADPAAIIADRRYLERWLPAPATWLEQVHGRDVVVVDAANAVRMRTEPVRADALVTRLPGVPLAIRVADCVPVLLAARDATVIAAAHAGWRGLAAGVLEATLAAMDVASGSVVAWLGPSIGPSAFEVGADVVAAFCDADVASQAHFRPLASAKWLADLHGLANRRLRAAGVAAIFADPSCTYLDRARFHSYRRDRTTQRMAALIWQQS